MHKTPQRRYVKVEFFGYAPVDLAIQLHLLGKKTDVNIVGEDMQPYLEYNGEYDKLHKPEVGNTIPLEVKQDEVTGFLPQINLWVSALRFYDCFERFSFGIG